MNERKNYSKRKEYKNEERRKEGRNKKRGKKRRKFVKLRVEGKKNPNIRKTIRKKKELEILNE